MRHPLVNLLAALAAEDESTRMRLLEQVLRDIKPRRRRALASILWC